MTVKRLSIVPRWRFYGPTARSPLLVVRFEELHVDDRYHVGTVLLFALELQQIEVHAATSCIDRPLSTDVRSSFVNGTDTSVLVEELTRFIENRVLDPIEHTLAGFLVDVRVEPFGPFRRDAEILREANQVRIGYLHAFVDRTTVADATKAIVLEF